MSERSPDRGGVFPFSAVVGMDDLRLALVLNAVSPAVGGVLVRGEKGTAKSTMVRALAAVLPDVEVIAGCRFSCAPAAHLTVAHLTVAHLTVAHLTVAHLTLTHLTAVRAGERRTTQARMRLRSYANRRLDGAATGVST